MNALLLTLAMIGADDRTHAQGVPQANSPQINGTWQVIYAEWQGQPLSTMQAATPISIQNNTVSFGMNAFRYPGAAPGAPGTVGAQPAQPGQVGQPGQQGAVGANAGKGQGLQHILQHNWRLDFGPNQTVRAHATAATGQHQPGQPGQFQPGQRQPGQQQPGQQQAGQQQARQQQAGQTNQQAQNQANRTNQQAQNQPGQPNQQAQNQANQGNQPNQQGQNRFGQAHTQTASAMSDHSGVYILGRDYLCLSFGKQGSQAGVTDTHRSSGIGQANSGLAQNPAPVQQGNQQTNQQTNPQLAGQQHAGQQHGNQSSGSFIVILKRQGMAGQFPGQIPGQVPGQIPGQGGAGQGAAAPGAAGQGTNK